MAIIESWNFEGGTYTGTQGTEIRVSGVTDGGTFRNSTGYLDYPAATNLPRIDYDEDLNCLGLLIEEAKSERTSDLRDQRSQYTSGLNSWSHQLGVSAENQETDPFGTASNADTFTDLDDGTTDNPYIWTTQSYSNATYHCTSVFVKALNAQTQWVYLRQFVGAVGLGWYDIKNGVLGSTSGALTSGMEAYANGWYRIWLATLSNGSSTGTIRIGLTDADLNTAGYASDGKSIATDCYQNEYLLDTTTGNRHPSSFSEGDRDDEEVVTNGVTWYTDPATALSFATSFFPNYGSGGIAPTQGYVFKLVTADINTSIALYNPSLDIARFWVNNNPGTDGQTDAASLNDDGSVEYVAGSVANNDMYMNCNGTAASDITVTWPLSDAVTKACLGWFNTPATQLNGHIKYLVFWDEQLSDATIDEYGTTGYTFPTSFPGNIAGDGGHVWPARANDPRWAQIITDSGITATGNFQDDVKAALLALSGASGGSPDDLWKKVKAANGVTDTSEPWLY